MELPAPAHKGCKPGSQSFHDSMCRAHRDDKRLPLSSLDIPGMDSHIHLWSTSWSKEKRKMMKNAWTFETSTVQLAFLNPPPNFYRAEIRPRGNFRNCSGPPVVVSSLDHKTDIWRFHPKMLCQQGIWSRLRPRCPHSREDIQSHAKVLVGLPRPPET